MPIPAPTPTRRRSQGLIDVRPAEEPRSQRAFEARMQARYRRMREHKKRQRRVMVSTSMLVLMLSAGFVGGLVSSDGDNGSRTGLTQAIATTRPDRVTALDESLFDATLPLDQVRDTGYLWLIDTEHPIPFEPTIDQLTSVSSQVPDNASGQMLDPCALEALGLMFETARAELAQAGNPSFLYVTSGYRSQAEQAQLFEEEPDKTRVQPPGSSEHHSGLAVDIGVQELPQDKLASSHEGAWVASNAARFGFVVRYPADKQTVTGISYEPWHLRYLGQPHAQFCEKEGLTLEEYLGFLQQAGGYRITLDTETYHVRYERADGETIRVPSTSGYSISSDNTGGYLVTVKE